MGLFDYIVSMSIRACVLVPIAVLVRTLLTKYPKRYSYALWLIVFASIIVKVNLPVTEINPAAQVQQSIQQQYNDVLDDYVVDVVIHYDSTEEYTQAVEQGIQPVISEEAKYVITDADSIAPPKTVKTSVMPKIQLVWLAGVLALLIVYIRNVLNMFGSIRFATHYKYDIYFSENITSPFVFGIVKPKIYLPYSITAQQAEHVIAHERVHIKRLDWIVKPLCLFITILHWFNPLVWLAFWLMNKDMEFSCDEAAVDTFDADSKKDYCTALVQFALKEESYRMSTVMFGESDCSRRIKNLLSHKRPYKLVAEMLVLVVLTTAIGCTAESGITGQFADMTFEQLEEYDIGQKSYFKKSREQKAVLQAMDDTDSEEIEAYLEKHISDYLAADNTMQVKDVRVSQDKLTLIYTKNEKSLCNGIVEIVLQEIPENSNETGIVTETEGGYSNLIMGNLLGYLGEKSDFITLKTKQLDITVFDENGELTDTYSRTSDAGFEDENALTVNKEAWKHASYIKKEQPKNELDAQKQFFSYGKSHNNFVLRKFGIADGTARLYVEYSFDDDWLLMGEGETEEKIARKTAELNDIYADITENVISHSAVKQYIADSGAQTAVIAFSHRFLENGIVEFSFALTDKEFVPDYDTSVEDSLPAEEIQYTTAGISYFNDAVIIGDSIAEGLRIYTNLENSIAEIADFITLDNYTPYEFMEAELWNSDQTATGFEYTKKLNPNKVYILMGTNALVFMDEKDFLAGYLDMVKALRDALPDKDIYICSIPPVGAEHAERHTIFKSLGYINGQLENFARDNGAYYLNLHEIFADDSKYGWLKEEYKGDDGVHFLPKAYTDIIEYLRTHIVAKRDGLVSDEYKEFLENIDSAQKEYTEDGIPIDEIKQYPGHIAVVPQEEVVFKWPTAGGVRITRGFTNGNSYEISPRVVDGKIRALNPGIITKAGDGSVVVSDATYEDIYIHCAEILVKEGDYVKEDQEIAVLDSTVSAKDYRMSQYPAAHSGVDIAGPLGKEIYAAADGVVAEAEYTTTGNGVYIVLEHSNGMKTLYAHCSELKAKAGDKVTAGQLIALMGSTGNSTGSHLHFEIIDADGVSVDPYKYW